MKAIFCVILVDIYEKILQSYQIRFMFYFFPLVLVVVVFDDFQSVGTKNPISDPSCSAKGPQAKTEKHVASVSLQWLSHPLRHPQDITFVVPAPSVSWRVRPLFAFPPLQH